MRNNNPDIIIHHLLERKKAREVVTGKRFEKDSKSIAELKEADVKAKQVKQQEREKEGEIAAFEFEGTKYQILIRKGEDKQERIKRFCQKLSRNSKKSV